MLSTHVNAQEARDSARTMIAERDFAWMDTLPLLRFSPPVQYVLWRAMAERCSGWKREGWPTFYLANREVLVTADGLAAALYSTRTESVVFALAQNAQRHIVIHELLHWLGEAHTLHATPGETDSARYFRQHPPEVFEGRCKDFLTRGN